MKTKRPKHVQAIEAQLNRADVGAKVVVFTTSTGKCAGAHKLATKDQGIAEAWARTYALGDSWTVKRVTEKLTVE